MEKKIALIEKNEMYRRRLHILLTNTAKYAEVKGYECFDDFEKGISSEKPDVVLIGVDHSSFHFLFASKLREKQKKTIILLMSEFFTPKKIKKAKEIGANGIITLEKDLTSVPSIIETAWFGSLQVMDNEDVINKNQIIKPQQFQKKAVQSKQIINIKAQPIRITNHSSATARIVALDEYDNRAIKNRKKAKKDLHPRKEDQKNPLSKRETEVVRHFVNGNTYSEIASLMGLSKETIKSHLKSIYKKTNVSKRSGLVSFIKKHKIVRFFDLGV